MAHNFTPSQGTQLYVIAKWGTSQKYYYIYDIECILNDLSTGADNRNYADISCMKHGKINIVVNREYPEINLTLLFDNQSGIHERIYNEAISDTDNEYTFIICDGDGTSQPNVNEDGIITYADNRTNKEFKGVFTACELISEINNVLKFNVTIKRTSKVKLISKIKNLKPEGR